MRERLIIQGIVLPERHIAVEVFALSQRPVAGQAVLRDRVEALAPCQVPAGLERRDGASILLLQPLLSSDAPRGAGRQQKVLAEYEG